MEVNPPCSGITDALVCESDLSSVVQECTGGIVFDIDSEVSQLPTGSQTLLPRELTQTHIHPHSATSPSCVPVSGPGGAHDAGNPQCVVVSEHLQG